MAIFKAEELRQRQRDELILEAMKSKSPEIRLLKRMLQVAQMNKERYGQVLFPCLLQASLIGDPKCVPPTLSSHLFGILKHWFFMFPLWAVQEPDFVGGPYSQRQDKALYDMEEEDRNAAFHEMLMENYNKLTKVEQDRLQKSRMKR
jgi:hypothetical protein